LRISFDEEVHREGEDQNVKWIDNEKAERISDGVGVFAKISEKYFSLVKVNVLPFISLPFLHGKCCIGRK
jgi:hypothetical protein